MRHAVRPQALVILVGCLVALALVVRFSIQEPIPGSAVAEDRRVALTTGGEDGGMTSRQAPARNTNQNAASKSSNDPLPSIQNSDVAEVLFLGPNGIPLCYRNKGGNLVLRESPWAPGEDGRFDPERGWTYTEFCSQLHGDYHMLVWNASDPIEKSRLSGEQNMIWKFCADEELRDFDYELADPALSPEARSQLLERRARLVEGRDVVDR